MPHYTSVDPRTARLIEAPILPTLLRLAVPNLVVMLAQAATGLVEAWYASRLGAEALAGVALVFPAVMLVQMISSGAMGGGILSAIARALGAGRRAEADALVWHALAIAAGLGALTSLSALTGGRALYSAMGGSGASLAAALAYSDVIFAGAVLIWLFNSLAAVIRGAGNLLLPALVGGVGLIGVIAVSPVLIFGWGPVPALGLAGGALAVLLYYAAGSLVFIAHLWGRRGVLRPAVRPPPLRWPALYEILRVGAVSALVSATTNITIAFATAYAGALGPLAVAGYGTAVRLEYVLVPVIFGLGGPMAAMTGTAIGAGLRQRALRVAWTGAVIAALLTESIGLAAAVWPHAWLKIFTSEPAAIEAGAAYLRMVGPFYGFYGLGLSLYFASQGAGKLIWPLTAGMLRLAVSVAGGWLALRHGAGLEGVYAALAAGLALFGLVNAGAIAGGAWFKGRP